MVEIQLWTDDGWKIVLPRILIFIKCIILDEIKTLSLEAGDYVDEEYTEDPFIPHERVFSKYAVMLYYSQDAGKTFYLHQDSKYCESCHEKVSASLSLTAERRIWFFL